MHLKLNLTKSFKKDLAKVKFSNEHYAKYVIYLGKLLSREILSPEARDHQLKGEWGGTKEFHISGDLPVIYMITDDELILVRIGSHSQLFS